MFLLASILISSIFFANHAVAEECSGIVVACDEIWDSEACRIQEGCSYNDYNGQCQNTPGTSGAKACNALSGTNCIRQLGCALVDQVASGFLEGETVCQSSDWKKRWCAVGVPIQLAWVEDNISSTRCIFGVNWWTQGEHIIAEKRMPSKIRIHERER